MPCICCFLTSPLDGLITLSLECATLARTFVRFFCLFPFKITAWATKMATAPDRIVHLTTANAVASFVNKATGVFVVGLFGDEERAEVFVAAAEK